VIGCHKNVPPTTRLEHGELPDFKQGAWWSGIRRGHFSGSKVVIPAIAVNLARMKWLLLAGLLVAGATLAADTVHLRDRAAVAGRLLSEKPDSVALDIGYTVLVIPRAEIERIERGSEGAIPGVVAPTATNGLYRIAPTNAPVRTVRELVAELGEAVVQVRTPGGLGSGFFLNEEGFLITNFHVIEGETQIWVEVYHQREGQLERRTYKQVRILAMNKFADLALLRIEDEGAPRFRSVPLALGSEPAVGERVFAIGSPLGLERTVTEGILSSKARPIQGALYLQTTAQINPGNSGGPLFNLAGQVVGVTNMKVTFGEGLGFAIPVAAVKHFLDHRDAFAYAADHPGNPYRYLEPPARMRRSAEQP
jgi:serine protease Do